LEDNTIIDTILVGNNVEENGNQPFFGGKYTVEENGISLVIFEGK